MMGCARPGRAPDARFWHAPGRQHQDTDRYRLAFIPWGAVKTVVERLQGKSPGTVFGDFRPVLDDKDIDVLVVGTPDHWHAIPTILACQAGKHVYVEKPDSHNIREGQTMVAAARKHRRVVQMGVQSRSGRPFRRGNRLPAGRQHWPGPVRASPGRALDRDRLAIRRMSQYPRAWITTPGWDRHPLRPFNPRRFHSHWRWFFDYGTGDQGNDGVHRLDMARRGLEAALVAQGGKPLGMPSVCSATGGKRYFDDMQEFPDTMFVTWDYPEQKATILYELRVWTPYKLDGQSEAAAIFGDKGYVIIGNRNWQAVCARRQDCRTRLQSWYPTRPGP